jgi:hypothetical protein
MGFAEDTAAEINSLEKAMLELVSAHGDDAVRFDGEESYINTCIIRDFAAQLGMVALAHIALGNLGEAALLNNTGMCIKILADLAAGVDTTQQVLDNIKEAKEVFGIDLDNLPE